MKPRKADPLPTPAFPPWLARVCLALWWLGFLALALVPDQKLLRYKLLAVEGCALALAAAAAASWLLSGRPALNRTPLDLPVLAYAGGGLLFFGISPERGASALELNRILFGAAAFFAASQTLPRLERPERAFAAWALGAGLIGAYCLLQVRGGLGPILVPQLERPIATFGNPIFLGAFLASALPPTLALAATATGRARLLYALDAVLAGAGLWTTQSRGALAGLGAAAVAAVLVRLSGRRRAGALAGLVLAGVLAAWWFRGRSWTHGLIWRDTLALWRSHPLLGCGLGRFHIEFPAHASEALRALWPQRQVIVNFAHNEYLQVLAETGVAGLALLAWPLAAFGRGAASGWPGVLEPRRRALLAGLSLAAATLLGQALFSPDLRFGVSTFVLFVCLGAAAALGAGREADLPAFPGRLGCGLGALALLAAWGSLASSPILAYRRLRAQPAFHVDTDQGVESLQRSIAGLERRLAERPEDSDAAETLGYLYAKLQRWPEAIARYETAARLLPGRPGPLNNLGNIQYSLGRREEAIAYWKRSLAASPDQLDAHLNLGKALYEVGRLKESSEHLQQVLTRDPANEKAQVLLKKMIE